MKYNFLAISIMCFSICCLTFYLLPPKKDKKIGMVDAIRLFNQYQMKLDLERNVEIRLNTLETKRDSIGNQYFNSDTSKRMIAAKTIMQDYEQMQQEIQNEYAMSNQQINEMVWKRLNPLIKEFGKNKELHLLIGANGMGSVLYYDDYYDMTDELIQFVNDKYENNN